MEQPLDYPASIRSDAALFAAAARRAGPDVPVRCCPGWVVRDLVAHLTEVQWFWAKIVAGRVQDPHEVGPLTLPSEFDALLQTFETGAEHLAAVLAAADPADPVWTWASQRTAGFVIRHQAQEAAVHRRDAEDAAGIPTPIDAAVAADAIDEWLEYSGVWRREDAEPLAGTVRLSATDTGGTWTITEDEGGRLVVGTDGEPGATAGATASDLLLLLYRRIGPESVSVDGDAALINRFLARTDLD